MGFNIKKILAEYKTEIVIVLIIIAMYYWFEAKKVGKRVENKKRVEFMTGDESMEVEEDEVVEEENQDVGLESESGSGLAPVNYETNVRDTGIGCAGGSATFVSSNLLPKEDVNEKVKNIERDMTGVNYLDAGESIGIDTMGSSLRNANYGIRDEPAIKKEVVSPWLNSTIEADPYRLALN